MSSTSSPIAYYNRGLAFMKKGDTKNARGDLQKALGLIDDQQVVRSLSELIPQR